MRSQRGLHWGRDGLAGESMQRPRRAEGKSEVRAGEGLGLFLFCRGLFSRPAGRALVGSRPGFVLIAQSFEMGDGSRLEMDGPRVVRLSGQLAE